MLKEAKSLYDSVKDTYLEMVSLIEALERRTQQELHTYGAQQVDTAYACRETIGVLDEMRKRINKISTAAQTVASVQMAALGQDRISTLHATATPNPRLWFRLVIKRDVDPKAHDYLQRFCGVPQEIAEREVLRIHPPNFCDFLTEKIGKGEEIPVNPQEITATELNLRITKKKDI